MFEKEAKRSFDELDDRGIGDDWSIEEAYENGFSNGGIFGYNILKEELELKNPNGEKCLELLKKKGKISAKRDIILQELQVLVLKTSEDLKLKLDRHFGSKA